MLSLYYPRTYSASTTFERRNDPVMIDLPLSAGAASFNFFRSTMQSDLTSVDTMGKVVENLGLLKDLERTPEGELTPTSRRQRDSLARALGSRLSITRVSPSEHIDIITVQYTGPDPTIGTRLVDEVKRTYIRRTEEWIHQFLVRQRDYFLAQAEEALEELKLAQRDETRMRLEKPYFNYGDPSALNAKLSQLELERRELLLRKREYETELAAQRQMLATHEARGLAPDGNGPSIAEAPLTADSLRIQTKVRELTEEIDRLRATRGMTDEHPEMKERLSTRRQLEAAFETQRLLDVEQASAGARSGLPMIGVDPAILEWQGERARWMVQIAAQEAKIAEMDISLQTNESAMSMLMQAKTEVFNNRDELEEIATNVTRARQRHSTIQSTLASIEPAIRAIEQNRLMQFSEGQPARGGSIPVSPRSRVIVLLALAAGIAAGVVCVILAEALDHVYRSSGQVSRSLGLPILEAIDEIVTLQDKRRTFVRRAVVAPVALTCLLGVVSLTGVLAYLSVEQPKTYQKIRNLPRSAIGLFH